MQYKEDTLYSQARFHTAIHLSRRASFKDDVSTALITAAFMVLSFTLNTEIYRAQANSLTVFNRKCHWHTNVRPSIKASTVCILMFSS